MSTDNYELGYEEGESRAREALEDKSIVSMIGSEITSFLDEATDGIMSEEYNDGLKDGFHDYLEEHGY